MIDRRGFLASLSLAAHAAKEMMQPKRHAAPVDLCAQIEELSKHVYKPQRLVSPTYGAYPTIVEAVGKVDQIFYNGDRDTVMKVILEPAYAWLLNPNNQAERRLTVEVICSVPISPATQAVMIDACHGYTNRITIPQPGDRIRARGVWTFDTGHGNHPELHPTCFLEVLAPPATARAWARDEA